MAKTTFLEEANLVLKQAGIPLKISNIIDRVMLRGLYKRRGKASTKYNSLYGTLIKAVQGAINVLDE